MENHFYKLRKLCMLFVLLLSGSGLFAQNTAKESGQKSEIEPIDRIVVTGTKTAQSEQEVVANVEVIDSEEIAQMGAQNVAQVIENLPGASVVSQGARPAASLQGLGGEYVKVLVDGVEVVGESAGAVSLDTLPVSNVERIEIVRGPASVLYGSEAIGGVINIISKKEEDKPLFLEASQEAATNEVFNGRIFTGINQGPFYFSLSGSYDYDDGKKETVYDSENFTESYTSRGVKKNRIVKLPITQYLSGASFLGSIQPKFGLRGKAGFIEMSGLFSGHSNRFTSDPQKHEGSRFDERRLGAGLSGKWNIGEKMNLGGFGRWKRFD
ncbi:MAG: TonB-dependent receptor plug domain-containing protein, partial [Spirochaetota bacterium]